MRRATQNFLPHAKAEPATSGAIVRRIAAFATLTLLAATSGAQADSASTSTSNGFARIIFVLDPMAHARLAMVDGVLTVAFDRKIAVDPAAIAQSLNTYISGGRLDPDGETFRFALAQSVRLHTSISGNQIAVDLTPQTFSGMPPDLPPPPPRQATAVDVAKLNALPIRTGAYSNFTRLVFDWPKNVSYAVFPGAGHITIRFEAMARPDFASFEQVSPPWVKEAGWRVENKGTVIEFETDSSSGFHDFRSGDKIVLDILAPKSDADAYNPPGAVKGEKPKITKLAAGAGNDASTAQAKEIADTAAKLKADAPASQAAPPTSQPQPAAPAPSTAASNTPSTPSPPVQSTTAQITTATATPAGTPPLPTNEAQAQRTHEGALVTLPGAATHAVAIFVRNMTAWIVVDGAPTVDAAHLKTALGEFPASVDVSSGNGVTVLRIGLKQPEQIAARADGSNLSVILAPHASETPTAIAFLRNDDIPGKPALSTLIPGATHIVPLVDPVAGDSLIVVPAGLGRATTESHNYAEFSALPTAAGLVITPLTDDLDIRVSQSRVSIDRPGGLQLTAPSLATADSPAALASTSDGPCFLDLAAWAHGNGGSFLDAQRRLRKTLASMKPEDADRARIALARFYLGNGFGPEALGLIDLTQASDPSLQGDQQLQTMRAAADFMMGRYRDAHNDIAGQAFDNNRHAALWRGLTEAALENWDGARKSLALADPVLHRYPADWQARARIAEANAALAAGGIETADSELARLPEDLPKSLVLDAQLARAQLYAQEGRTRDSMDLFGAIENSGDEHAAAKAIYARVEAGLAAGTVSQDGAIPQLEMLRYRWRGDVLELKTLRKLGALYFAKQRWHDGLQILRTASQNFPNEDVARQAQDDMRDTFETLF
ncbi:MAG: hypothetical protein ABSC92_12885, partial [Rhizomicrobium sp.]